MKVLRTITNSVLIDSLNRVLKVRPDTYIEPLPNVFMLQINLEAGQSFTIPTPNTLPTWMYCNLQLFTEKDGTVLAETTGSFSNNNTARFLAVSLLADTEYYFKLPKVNSTTQSYFAIQVHSSVAGGTTGIPTDEPDVKSILVGNAIDSIVYGNNIILLDEDSGWFKFKTGSAGSYTIRCTKGTLEDHTDLQYDYNVDWGDESTLQNITAWDSEDRIHTYEDGGSFVIMITGQMPGFSVNNDLNIRTTITSAISYGEVGLRYLDFYGCSGLASLPDQQGKLTKVLSFANFCRSCTILSSIPYGTFWGNEEVPDIWATSFALAFDLCSNLGSIHSLLFRDCSNVKLFSQTFQRCAKILALPDMLFRSCYKVTSWSQCFAALPLIQSIPSGFFYRDMVDEDYSKVAISSMHGCFGRCTGLSTVGVGVFSSPQVDNLGINMVKANSLAYVFANCTSLQIAPDYIFHNQVHCVSAQGTFSRSSLIETPVSCFEGCINITNFSGASSVSIGGSTGSFVGVFATILTLTKVNANCFSECYAATTYNSAFSSDSALIELCINIFHDSPLVTDFSATFYNCALPSVVGGTGYQLDHYIFINNTNARTFNSTFAKTTAATNQYVFVDIPESLFTTCTLATQFYNTFGYNRGVITLPPNLFRNQPLAGYFNRTFHFCSGLEKIPVIIEDSVEYGFFEFCVSALSFGGTFHGAGLTNDMDGETILVPAIPINTFKGLTNVAGTTTTVTGIHTCSFRSTFEACTQLQRVNGQLFKDCISARLFSRLFFGCTHDDFTSLPNDLFQGLTNALSFDHAFYNVKLESIPSGLFSDALNVQTFDSTFYNTNIISIPTGLFDSPGASVQNFNSTFYNCSFLTAIQSNLFNQNINVTTFNSTFYGCILLTAIPIDLFRYNDKVVSFNATFYNNAQLVHLPEKFFQYNNITTVFLNVFALCIRLKIRSDMFYEPGEENTKFASRNMNFNTAFNRASFVDVDGAGIAPNLWECNFNTISSTNTFGGAGNSLTSISNYDDIPAGWK